MKMKRMVLSSLLVLGFCLSATAGITGMGDIEFWVGSGANSTAMVIDFHDGETSESFAWGYRWDGTDVSGADMMIAIAAADANLSLTYSGNGTSGFFLTGVNYFDGITSHSKNNGAFTSHPTDFLSWGYYINGGFSGEDGGGQPQAIAGSGTSLPGSWTVGGVGASDLDYFGDSGRLLTDGAWDAWSFGQNDEFYTHEIAPGGDITAAAVPEPASAMLILLGSCGIFGFRRYKASIGA